MIMVTVRLSGLFRKYSCESQLCFKLKPESTFRDLLEEMAASLGEDFRKEVSEKIDSDPALKKLVFVDNSNLAYGPGPDMKLEDGTTVMFLPPMEGG